MDIKKGDISKDLYRTIMKNVPICTVDVIFFNSTRTRVLLFKRINNPLKNKYFSIGGRVLKNESLINATMRQTRKEIDLTIKKNDLFLGGVQEEIYKNSPFTGVNNHSIDVFFGYILPLNNPPIKLDEQHSQWKWFSVKDTSLHPYLRKKIEKTLEQYSKLLLRDIHIKPRVKKPKP